MSRYLILLPAPEAEWADLPPEEHEKGHASHVQFQQDLEAGGHELLVAGPLEPSADGHLDAPGRCGRHARHRRTRSPSRRSRWSGFYLVRSDDEADLRAACERWSSRGELLEFRRMAE